TVGHTDRAARVSRRNNAETEQDKLRNEILKAPKGEHEALKWLFLNQQEFKRIWQEQPLEVCKSFAEFLSGIPQQTVEFLVTNEGISKFSRMPLMKIKLASQILNLSSDVAGEPLVSTKELEGIWSEVTGDKLKLLYGIFSKGSHDEIISLMQANGGPIAFMGLDAKSMNKALAKFLRAQEYIVLQQACEEHPELEAIRGQLSFEEFLEAPQPLSFEYIHSLSKILNNQDNPYPELRDFLEALQESNGSLASFLTMSADKQQLTLRILGDKIGIYPGLQKLLMEDADFRNDWMNLSDEDCKKLAKGLREASDETIKYMLEAVKSLPHNDSLEAKGSFEHLVQSMSPDRMHIFTMLFTQLSKDASEPTMLSKIASEVINKCNNISDEDCGILDEAFNKYSQVERGAYARTYVDYVLSKAENRAPQGKILKLAHRVREAAIERILDSASSILSHTHLLQLERRMCDRSYAMGLAEKAASDAKAELEVDAKAAVETRVPEETVDAERAAAAAKAAAAAAAAQEATAAKRAEIARRAAALLINLSDT
ncbi:MAG: hypothetical protein AAF621_04815, partial [Pseudomonadota bacterium]